MLLTKAAHLGRRSWSMPAMLRDDVFRRTRLQSIPLAMLAMKKELHGFYFYSHMWLCSYSY